MGDAHYPPHYGEVAKAFQRRTRAAEIAVFMEVCMPRLRDAARCCGYALAVHGSLARDLDVVAIPWVQDAADPDALSERLTNACKEATGWGHAYEWSEKPHGRIARTILASDNVHVDLSVMPRQPKPEEPEDA